MAAKTKKIKFDPGFAPYILAFQGTVEYLYRDINRFKNLSQRKMRFKQFYTKLLSVFNNNLGFYVGCLLWAAYIKTLPEDEIIGNHCYGKKYNEEENKAETQYMLQFAELFPKDMKYFLGQDFSFDESVIKILKTYEEFTVINKGFVDTKNNTKILLPENIKTENAKNYNELIDKILKTKDLSKLLEYTDTIL